MGPLSLKKALLLLWLLLLPGEGTWYELNWWRIRFWGGRFFYFYLNGQGWEELTTNEVKSLQKAMEKDPAMGQYIFGEDFLSHQGFLSGVEIGGGHQGWWTTAKSLKKAWPHPFGCGVIQKTLAQAGPHSHHKLWGGLSGLSLQKAQALMVTGIGGSKTSLGKAHG